MTDEFYEEYFNGWGDLYANVETETSRLWNPNYKSAKCNWILALLCKGKKQG
jgi:hypothetical protein